MFKAKLVKEALVRQKTRRGKRKRYEERMMRKVNEGKTSFGILSSSRLCRTYSRDSDRKLRSNEQQPQTEMALWKERDHSQHCAFTWEITANVVVPVRFYT
jgi:hypothetical protein